MKPMIFSAIISNYPKAIDLMRFFQLLHIIKVSIPIAIVTTGIVNAATPVAKVKFVIEPRFDTAEDFAEGLAKVGFGKNNDDPYGYIDITNYGYIDRTGKLTIPAKFTDAGNFLAVAELPNIE